MRANKHRRKGRNTRPFFLFLKPSERERKPTAKPTKPRKQDKTKRRSQAGKQDKSRTKAGQRGKERKTKGERRNTQQAPKPPNLSRTQKPHNPRKDPNPYKYTSAPQNPPKTPLKCEIKPYSNAMHHKQSRKEGKGREKGTEHTQREGAGAHHLHSVDTTTATTKEDESSTTKAPNPKYISLLPLLVSDFPEKTPRHTKKLFTFATFCPN